MKKIDDAVIKETEYIAVITGILSLLMQAVFLVIGKWDYTVLTGNLLSGFFAVLNFFLMGIGIQKALGKEEKEAKSTLRLSRTYRMIMLLLVISLGVSLPFFHIWAVIIPVFFPRIAIFLYPVLRKNDIEKEADGK